MTDRTRALHPAEVMSWQASREFHPITCRNCRGTCERRDVGNVAGDHHVLSARHAPSNTGVALYCGCCGHTQPFPERLVDNVPTWILGQEHPNDG